MHDSSESFGELILATTDRDTRASLSFPSSNYSEFMIALKFVHSDKHSVIKDKLALHDCLSRSVAATKPNDPLTHRTPDEQTKGRNAMRASRFVIETTYVVATERGTRQPVLPDLKLQRRPDRLFSG